jgi:hypothetical protein
VRIFIFVEVGDDPL